MQSRDTGALLLTDQFASVNVYVKAVRVGAIRTTTEPLQERRTP